MVLTIIVGCIGMILAIIVGCIGMVQSVVIRRGGSGAGAGSGRTCVCGRDSGSGSVLPIVKRGVRVVLAVVVCGIRVVLTIIGPLGLALSGLGTSSFAMGLRWALTGLYLGVLVHDNAMLQAGGVLHAGGNRILSLSLFVGMGFNDVYGVFVGDSDSPSGAVGVSPIPIIALSRVVDE